MTQLWTDENVLALATQLSADASAREVAKALKINLKDAGKFHGDFENVWPLLRVAYKSNQFKQIVANRLPVASYPLTAEVNLEREPLGYGEPVPHVELREQPKKIAGFTVDFPLGVPASMITGNSKYLKHYAERGFCILTYKTVRSRLTPPRPYPHWIFLKNGSGQLDVEKLRAAVLKDPENYSEFLETFVHCTDFPEDPAHTSMANSFGIPSLVPDGPGGWMEDVGIARKFVRSGHQVLIVSVVATVEKNGTVSDIKRDFVRTAEMAKEAGADIIELNLSCPNTAEKKEGEIFNNAEDAKSIIAAVKAATKTPLFIKTGYVPEEKLRELIVATSGDIDGIVAMNTVSARIADSKGKQLFPERPTAGVSGWAINNIAQEMAVSLVKICEEIGRRETLSLIGLGGVMNDADFWERLNTGVDAVEICTAAFLDPYLGLKIREVDTKTAAVKNRASIEKDGTLRTISQPTGSAPKLSEGEGDGGASPVQGDHMNDLHRRLTAENKAKLEELLASNSPLPGEKEVSPGVDLRNVMRRAFASLTDDTAAGRKDRDELRAKLAAENPGIPFFRPSKKTRRKA